MARNVWLAAVLLLHEEYIRAVSLVASGCVLFRSIITCWQPARNSKKNERSLSLIFLAIPTGKKYIQFFFLGRWWVSAAAHYLPRSPKGTAPSSNVKCRMQGSLSSSSSVYLERRGTSREPIYYYVFLLTLMTDQVFVSWSGFQPKNPRGV